MKFVMKLTKSMFIVSALISLILSGCNSNPVITKNADEPEKLYIYEDGRMEFRDRAINKEDVVIYPDGFGGERAAVKLSLEPLHPPFYRDTIVVVRKNNEEKEV